MKNDISPIKNSAERRKKATTKLKFQSDERRRVEEDKDVEEEDEEEDYSENYDFLGEASLM